MTDWKEPLKLELGAGEHPSPGGYTHNDVLPYPHIEIVADCRRLPMVACGSVTIIRAIHLLEHFGPNDAKLALGEWVRCLCPRGVLELAMPDLQHLALMTILGNITQEAFLRDLYGLFPPPQWLTPDLMRTMAQCLRRGMGPVALGGQAWLTALAKLSEPTWWSGADMPQAHRWGYCAETLRLDMQKAGLERIVVERDGTALHAWGEKGSVGLCHKAAKTHKTRS